MSRSDFIRLAHKIMYDLPKTDFNNIKNKVDKIFQNTTLKIVVLIFFVLVAVGFYTGAISLGHLYSQGRGVLEDLGNSLLPQVAQQQPVDNTYVSSISYEQAIINVVKEASPSVVSIIISKNLPVYETQYINPFEGFPGFGPQIQIPQYVQKGTEKKQVGAGSGFIVSADGLILTNKHVVVDKDAEYTVLTNDGKKYSAKVMALDPVQDLAIIKISRSQSPDKVVDSRTNRSDRGSSTESGQDSDKFPAIKLGDSSGIQIGQGAIAIGNALGEFRNTVSVGVISGLGRTILASGGQGFSETLEDVIQTDAAINLGNSGGPLLNLKGEVIGVNTAMAEGAQAVGFAIPINIAKKDIDQINKTNKIVYPFLGVRYVLVDETVKKKYKLSIDYGALLLKGSGGEPAITKDSAAEKAGLKEKDVILEVNGEKITKDNSMAKIIQKYNPGDTVVLKVLKPARNASGIADAGGDGKEMDIEVTLGERS